jgi:alkaline phosphatase D
MMLPSRRRVLRQIVTGAAALSGLPVFVRHALAADAPRFTLGVASGSPTATSVVLWTRVVAPAALAAFGVAEQGDGVDDGTARLPPEVPVQWEVAADEAFSQIVARGTEPARAAEAHTVHAEVTGLAPGRVYWYRFAALGQRSAAGRTRTAPAADADVARLDFAIASCQRWEHGHWAAWRDLAANAPDLVLFLGDYIYEYASVPNGPRSHALGAATTLAGYRARYALYKSDPLLQAAHAVAPWVVIWDDHEVENDYAGVQSERLHGDFAARRAAAYRAWWEHMPLPHALRPLAAGGGAMTIHGRLDWGRLARLQWVDDRQFRDPQLCPRADRGGGSNTVRLRDCPGLVRETARTLLGAAQERWLAEGWSTAHPWNLLAQQTLMARFTREAVAAPSTTAANAMNAASAASAASAENAANGLGPAADAPLLGRYWTDGWDGYPAARQRLLSVLAERRVPNPVVFGGDVHANYVADLHVDFDAAGRRAPIATEFCGTSISSRGSAQSSVDAALRFNPHIRYGRSEERGYGRFTLTRERLSADLRVVADPADPASAVKSGARFVVEAGRAGAVKG